MYVYYVTYSLLQHTFQVLLMVFEVQPLRKHEATNPLQPTGHVTQITSHTGLCSSCWLPSRDPRFQHGHLSECFRQRNNFHCRYIDSSDFAHTWPHNFIYQNFGVSPWQRGVNSSVWLQARKRLSLPTFFKLSQVSADGFSLSLTGTTDNVFILWPDKYCY